MDQCTENSKEKNSNLLEPREGQSMIRVLERYIFNALENMEEQVGDMPAWEDLVHAYSCFRGDLVNQIQDIGTQKIGELCLGVLSSVITAYEDSLNIANEEEELLLQELIFDTQIIVENVAVLNDTSCYIECGTSNLSGGSTVCANEDGLVCEDCMCQSCDFYKQHFFCNTCDDCQRTIKGEIKSCVVCYNIFCKKHFSGHWCK